MEIIVPKGIVPVHMFDVYGVILDADKMCESSVASYRQVAQETHVPEEVAAKVISDYQALCRNEPWTTGARKVEIIQAMQDPLAKAGIQKSCKGCFNEDAFETLRMILDAGEGVSIFSSGNNDSMRKEMPEDISSRAGIFYDISKFTYETSQKSRTKSEPASFVELVGLERALGRHVVSHTADELPELIAALQSGTIVSSKLVYINRNNSNSEQAVQQAGISQYVNDLRQAKYLAAQPK